MHIKGSKNLKENNHGIIKGNNDNKNGKNNYKNKISMYLSVSLKYSDGSNTLSP